MRFEHCRDCREEVVWWAFTADIGMTLFKGILGLMSGSVALVADSLHSGADVVASGVTQLSLKISNKPADARYPFGYGNIQYISSAIVGSLLFIGASFLMYGSVMKLISGTYEAPSFFAAIGASVTVIVNELMYRYQICVGNENNSPAIIANAWDNRSDAISSAAVMIGVIASVIGFPIADTIAAVGVSALVGRIGLELIGNAVHGLMDSSVDTELLQTAWQLAMNTPLVESVYFLRGRHVGEEVQFDIRLRVSPKLKVKESTLVAEAVRQRIQEEIPHARDIRLFVSPAPVVAVPAKGK
ncbi:magnetosome biogenesis CDF transporter MamB [Magnetospirillum sp. UT-4]|uniref:magnetosome biogenesis CDF transporter MamB n=1 Tax=Magnetospirillum sp. UT-4 TaxID=2681467 RepID=UPI00137F8BCB|nr:magnetosome biogenesis CDF transporter MamB [Magnetospirillum sp. UT-4]CAA7622257.1 Predicted Co/Zn/Cd cation transporters [Magnetospirillum sp. UT-4]